MILVTKQHIYSFIQESSSTKVHWMVAECSECYAEYKVLTFPYKVLAGTAPKYICDLVK